jgi:deoxyribose-phosphate aldolase
MTNTSNELSRSDAARLILSCLDLTELGDHSGPAEVDALCERARGEAFGMPPVAAVCVWPRLVAHARQQLPAGIAVAAVVNFPSGDEALSDVLAQVAQIRAAGGQEVDCVLPYKRLMRGQPDDLNACVELLRQVRHASEGMVLKVILESGELGAAESIQRASQLALDAGADFLKTSTGKTAHGASLEAADVMLQAIAASPRAERLGFKPSGGLRTVADVLPYLERVRYHLGAGALIPARFRIGASGLWTDLARHLGVGAANTTAPGGAAHY